MMPRKEEQVYVIVASDIFTVSWDNAIKKTFELERDIAILAKRSGAIVHFHQYKNPAVGTPPAVLLECSAEFLEKVKRLPSFASVYPLNTGAKMVETVRRSDLPQIEPPQSQNHPKP